MIQYLVQHAGAAFGSTREIAESWWKTLSEHDTRQEAEQAMSDEFAEMVRRCGPTAWDDHFRIVKEERNTMSRTEQLVQELQSRLDIEIGVTRDAIGHADQSLCMMRMRLYEVPSTNVMDMGRLQDQVDKQLPKVLALEEMLSVMKALRKDLDGYLEALTEVEEAHKDG